MIPLQLSEHNRMDSSASLWSNEHAHFLLSSQSTKTSAIRSAACPSHPSGIRPAL